MPRETIKQLRDLLDRLENLHIETAARDQARRDLLDELASIVYETSSPGIPEPVRFHRLHGAALGIVQRSQDLEQ